MNTNTYLKVSSNKIIILTLQMLDEKSILILGGKSFAILR